MALRIRRGTEAQLQLITPVEGELIYTTDSKDLYVGDGTTIGGVKVGGDIPTSINDLTDVNLSGISIGQVLKWNGSSFVPSNDDTIVGTSEGVIEGSNYRINVVADDSTTLVDVTSKNINGLFVGNIYDDFSDTVILNPVTRLSKIDIVSDSDVLILSHNSADLYNGAGSQLIDGNSKVFFGDLDGNIRGSLVNQSLTKILVNHITETLQGTLIGDVQGSVFGDNSTILVDGVNSVINLNGTIKGNIETEVTDDFARFVFVRQSDTDISNTDLPYGSIQWRRRIGTGGTSTHSIISGGNDALLFANGKTSIGIDKFMVLDEGKLSIGGFAPQATLDVRGDGLFQGDVEAAAFKGSLMADDSTTIVDAINGNITTPGYIQFGSFSDAQRLELPVVNGMVIYNTDDNRFQGIQNGNWINLDDGTVV